MNAGSTQLRMRCYVRGLECTESVSVTVALDLGDALHWSLNFVTHVTTVRLVLVRVSHSLVLQLVRL